jgi:hypothetical protein
VTLAAPGWSVAVVWAFLTIEAFSSERQEQHHKILPRKRGGGAELRKKGGAKPRAQLDNNPSGLVQPAF